MTIDKKWGPLVTTPSTECTSVIFWPADDINEFHFTYSGAVELWTTEKIQYPSIKSPRSENRFETPRSENQDWIVNDTMRNIPSRQLCI